MIQTGTFLNVLDNSGAKSVFCIKVLSGYKRRYAKLGDKIIVSIKRLRLKRRLTSKVKKGEIYTALIIKTKIKKLYPYGDSLSLFENGVLLLNKQNKLIGTRIFGALPKIFRYTKYLKFSFLASGLIV
jgi:large subunit ribosomal protein L14